MPSFLVPPPTGTCQSLASFMPRTFLDGRPSLSYKTAAWQYGGCTFCEKQPQFLGTKYRP